MGVLVIFFSLLLAICTALRPIFVQKIVDMCTEGNMRGMMFYFLCYFIMIVCIVLFEMIRKITTGKYQVNKIKDLKDKLIYRIIHMPVKNYRAETGQNYLTIFNQELEMLVENYYVERLNLIYSVLVLVTSMFALIYVDFFLAILTLFFTILPITVSSMQGKRLQERTNLYTKSLEKFNVMIGNLVSGYATIRVNHSEKKVEKRIKQYNEDTSEVKFKEIKTHAFVNMLIAALAYLGEIFLIGAGMLLIAAGKLTIGGLLAALEMLEMLAIPTNSIAYELNNINSVQGIRKKLELLFEEAVSLEEKKICCPEIESIEFKDVSFSYADHPVLQHINLKFEAGKKYLLLGENGSGKSTLFKLLSKFEEEYEGQILINGIDLRMINETYFDKVGIVLQSPFLMNETLFHNLTFYNENYGKKEIIKIMESLGMSKFLKDHNLEEVYQDTKDNFSGGEKQKLALTRVLLRNQSVILLDEATAAIDAESSYLIEDRILKEKQKLVINIEHKVIPELMSLYDEVLEIKDCKISSIKLVISKNEYSSCTKKKNSL